MFFLVESVCPQASQTCCDRGIAKISFGVPGL